jgi:hypothetical protein
LIYWLIYWIFQKWLNFFRCLLILFPQRQIQCLLLQVTLFTGATQRLVNQADVKSRNRLLLQQS